MGEIGSTDIGMFTEIKTRASQPGLPLLLLSPLQQTGCLVNRVFLLIRFLQMGKKYKAGLGRGGEVLESTFLVLHLGQNPLLTQSWLHCVKRDLGEAAWKGNLASSHRAGPLM